MTDTSKSAFSLSLRPWPGQSKQAESSAELQARLFQQRGHFRHITEAGLEEEIRAAAAGETKDGEDADSHEGEHELTEKEWREKLVAQKILMLNYLQQANNEAMIARDFISLLISKDSPKTAQISLSPAAREAVPMGSLGWTRWHRQSALEPTSEEKEQEERDALLAQGARVQALNNAADILLNAATRLETDVRRETKYWEQVLSITEKGWSVRKIQNDRFNMGVQLGFAEASDQFKRRGFTPLRTDEDGSVILDQELTKTPHTLRVRIVQDGVILGTSQLRQHVKTDHAELEQLIGRARDSLFDEELFHEISLETRELLSYDVKMKDSTIRIPLMSPTQEADNKREIQIDLMQLSESTVPSHDPSLDDLAQNIAIALRLLLSRVHRQRLQRRSELPAPLSSRKEQKPPEAILRPLMAFFLHRRDAAAVRHCLEQTRKILRSAGLAMPLEFHTCESITSSITKNLASSTSPSPSPISTLLAPFVQTLHSTALLTLPSSSSQSPSSSTPLHITLTISTKLSPPTFGTLFTLHPPALSIPTVPALCTHIHTLLALDIAHNILGPRVLPRFRPDERQAMLYGVLGGAADTNAHPDKACMVSVALRSDRLVVRRKMVKAKQGREDVLYHVWTAEGGSSGNEVVVDIAEVVRRFVGVVA
ncbi:hypothetical protein EJ05DRAFT_508194 [Pseudovirgaria hyperparasitica]|uniref:Mediator of RNA polymerase II transcription subunit 17 n=1 Tax=Pseudovirgaria hyperparasitica TaxID=470096 RepID=A0A6A6WG89_9PEZI|nr:uncharacterized protein EJ05DRAFT_508194 [Pseudovirgaria hyperparasitica]KAF2760966.1 hypothetical protein EJ05DRAFT_508194 [Pseudovirgaria hyperparasitica]